MIKGDIVLITFPFTDLSGSKLRPAILATTYLDLTVCFITTQTQWQEITDVLLLSNFVNGLKKHRLSGQVKLLRSTKHQQKDF